MGSFVGQLKSILQETINDPHFIGRKPEAKSSSDSVAKLGHDFPCLFSIVYHNHLMVLSILSWREITV
jgi:hypothetical protein